MEFPPTPLPPTNWVDTTALMAHLGIKARVTVGIYIKQGLPAHKVGKGYRFDLTEVDAWVRSRGAGGDFRWNQPAAGETA